MSNKRDITEVVDQQDITQKNKIQKKGDSDNLADINVFLTWLNENGAHMENIRLEYLSECK